MSRYANYPSHLKDESKAFINALSVGDKLWPKGHAEELTVASLFAQNHTAISYEESMYIHMYPHKDRFHSKLAVWWMKNVLPRLEEIRKKVNV